jgi:hypothetical protein
LRENQEHEFNQQIVNLGHSQEAREQKLQRIKKIKRQVKLRGMLDAVEAEMQLEEKLGLELHNKFHQVAMKKANFKCAVK